MYTHTELRRASAIRSWTRQHGQGALRGGVTCRGDRSDPGGWAIHGGGQVRWGGATMMKTMTRTTGLAFRNAVLSHCDQNKGACQRRGCIDTRKFGGGGVPFTTRDNHKNLMTTTMTAG